LFVQLNETTKLCKPRGDAFKKFVEHFLTSVKINYMDYCKRQREAQNVAVMNAVSAMENQQGNTTASVEDIPDADF